MLKNEILNKDVTTSISLSVSCVILLLFGLGLLIGSNSDKLKISNYPIKNVFWCSFCVLLILFSILYYNDIFLGVKWSSLFNELNYDVSYMSSGNSDKPSLVNATGSQININQPSTSITVPVESVKVVGTAITGAAGVSAGVRLAQQVPSIGGKAIAVVGTAALAQALNLTANTIMSNQNNNNNRNSFISNSFVSNTLSETNAKYAEYPLNLIPQLDTYVNIEFIFIFILINALLGNYISKSNLHLDNYIKNKNILKFLNVILARYIKMWSISSKILIIWSLIALIICMSTSKLILIIALS